MARDRVLILCPVYNDWEAAGRLFAAIDHVAEENGLHVSILAVDDGSSQPFHAGLGTAAEYTAVAEVGVLELGRNMGHQRAIAVGLGYVAEHEDCEAVVVMDADGEDDPRYIPGLLAELDRQVDAAVIFGQRTRRSEGPVFRFCYRLYRGLYRLLTGSRIQVGNFCIIPAGLLPKIVLLPEIWNHFAAGLLRGRIPFGEMPTVRARRLTGLPKMSFTSLVLHGLSAISVRADVAAARSLIAAVAWVGLTVMAGISMLVLSMAGGPAVPAWTGAAVVVSLSLAVQAVLASAIVVVLILRGRSAYEVLPRRDYREYIHRVHRIWPERGELVVPPFPRAHVATGPAL